MYGSQFLLDAVYKAHDAEHGLQLLTSTGSRGWYNMIRAGSTITMEAWDDKYKPNQDWNHAWGAVPANIIPRYLVEQITDRQYTIEDFYSIGNVLQADPLQQVYVLLNDDRLVKGFLWFHVIPFTRSIFVNAFSVDPEYRDGEGGPLRYAVELLKSIYDRLKLTGSIRFTTTFPEYYEKHGMRKSKFVSMEV